MSIINKLIPKHIIETNLNRLKDYFVSSDPKWDPDIPIEDRTTFVPETYNGIRLQDDCYPTVGSRSTTDPWFENPLDSKPIATDNPRPEEEVADNITMHERMYRLATENGKHTVGGSEACHGSGHIE